MQKQVSVSSVLPFCSSPFKEEVQSWIGKLAVVSETIEGWLAVQVYTPPHQDPVLPACSEKKILNLYITRFVLIFNPSGFLQYPKYVSSPLFSTILMRMIFIHGVGDVELHGSCFLRG